MSGRVVVVGAGAIGASLAALLARAGRDVALVARGADLAALRAGPLRVTGAAGAFEARVAALEAAPADAALVVLAVKAPDLEGALAALPPSEAPVVTTQNGLAAEDVAARVVAPERVVGCVTAYDAERVAPGEVHVGRAGQLTLGRPEGPPDATVETARALLAPAMEVETTANLSGARWLKLLVNLNNAIPAATGLALQDALADRRLARLAVRMLGEGVRVARAEGVRLEPLPYAKPGLVALLAALPEPVAARLYAARARRVLGDAPFRGSTWQSVARGRPTEIDWLNGEVARRGRERGVATPANDAVVAAVREVEKGGGFWSAERLATAALQR